MTFSVFLTRDEKHPLPDTVREGVVPIEGRFAGVLLMPVLPFLEDSDEGVLAVVEAAARAGRCGKCLRKPAGSGAFCMT